MADRNISLIIYIRPNYAGKEPEQQGYSSSGPETESLYINAELPALPASFAREGFDFLGYGKYAEQSFGLYKPGDVISYEFPIGATLKTDDFYCIWEAKKFTVSYSANGGTGAPEQQTKQYDEDIILSTQEPTREGYSFLGWAASSTGKVIYQPGEVYGDNADITLYAIWGRPRSKILTITDPSEIGAQGIATWDILDAGYTYKLELSYEDAPIVAVNAAANSNSATYTIPVSWLNYLPNATQATAKATLTTYSGDEVIGTFTRNFVVSVAESVKPSITSFTVTPYSDNPTVSGWEIFVGGYSKADLTVNATAGTGADILSIRFIVNREEIQNSLQTTARTPLLQGYNERLAEVIVTDTRGRTATAETTFIIYQYAPPEVNSIDLYRCLSDGTRADIEGTYARITPRFKFASCGGNNTLTVNKISDKLHESQTWTDVINGVASGSSYTIGGNFAVTSSYDIRLIITDSLGNTAALIVILPPTVGFALGLKNDRARFGGPTEKPGLQVDWVSEFNDSTDFNGETVHNDKATFNGIVDLTNRRCSATLSNTGWYRVITISSDLYVGPTNGGESSVIDIAITRSANHSGSSESHKIKMLIARSNISGQMNICVFSGEESASGVLGIKKIRYSLSADEKTGYVDIYYDLSGQVEPESEGVTVSFDVSVNPEYQGKFSPVLFTKVNEAQANETVLASHDFSLKTDADEVTYTALGKSWRLTKRNGIVYLNAPSSIQSASVGFNYIAGTLPEQFRPLYRCFFPIADYAFTSDYYIGVEPGGSFYLYSGEQIAVARNCAVTASWIAK